MLQLARLLKILGDETRLSILNLLRVENLCVCEIEAILENSQSNVSRHLAKLRDAGIIYSETRAQWVYYSIDPEIVKRYPLIKVLLDEEMVKNPEYQAELDKLKLFRAQNNTCLISEEINT